MVIVKLYEGEFRSTRVLLCHAGSLIKSGLGFRESFLPLKSRYLIIFLYCIMVETPLFWHLPAGQSYSSTGKTYETEPCSALNKSTRY